MKTEALTAVPPSLCALRARGVLGMVQAGVLALVALAMLAGARLATAQCTGDVTLAVAGAPDQALIGETCCVRGGEVFFGAPNSGMAYIFRRHSTGAWMQSAGTLARPGNVTVLDAFGRSLAVDNEVAAVGAPLWSGGQGTVTLYKRNAAGTWSTLQQIVPPVGQANLFFGCSLSMSHGFLLIGAPGAVNGAGWRAGIAYLYERQVDGTFALLATLTPSSPNAAVDGMFGQCVSISGSTMIVGAPGELYANDSKRGSLYTYQRQTSGFWTLLERRKSPTTGVTVRNFATDCCIDNGYVAVREQIVNPGAADRVWLYSVGASNLVLEPSYTAGRSIEFSYDPPTDAALVGSISIRENFMGVGSRTTETCDIYTRGASSWVFSYQLTNGGAGDIDFGASVGIGHDIMAIGMPYWVAGVNLQPGAVWARSHVNRNCDGAGATDACEAMSLANSGFDLDYDGIPNNCESAGAPGALVCTQGVLTSGVGVDWRIVYSASQYQVQRSNGDPPTTIATTWAPDYLDTSADPDVLYTYYLRSVDGAGNVSSGFIQNTGWRAFAAPTGLTASDGTSGTEVTVDWNAVDGAPAYRVYRRIGNGNATMIGEPATNTFADTTAVAGTTYTYFVTVKGVLGESAASNTNTGYVSNANVPTAVQASDGTSTDHVTITWNAVASTSGYKVYRAVGNGSFAFLHNVDPADTTYDDATATPLVQYNYAVANVLGGNAGPLSTPNGGWRNVPPPATFTASDGTSTAAVLLAWSAVSGSTGYIIWRAPTGQPLVQLASVSANVLGYADPATPGVSYTYAVQAKHARGTTDLSATDAGWRALAVPGSLAASDGTYGDKIRITWTAVASAIGYRLKRTLPGDTEMDLVDLPAGTTTYDDTTTAALDVVQYRVQALGSAGNGAIAAADSGWRNYPAPANLAASDGAFTDKVLVEWDEAAGADEYKLMRSIAGAVPTVIATVPSGTHQFEDGTAPAIKLCTYTVLAVHGASNSLTSAGETGWRNVAAPTLNATDGTEASAVVLTWTGVPGITGYRIMAGPDPGALVQVTQPGKNATSWKDKNAPVATQRFYAIRVVHALGTSALSAVEDGWKGLKTPKKPSASDGKYMDRVAVTWKAVDGATGYMLRRVPVNMGEDVDVDMGPFATLATDDTTAIPNVRYLYSVSAVCALGATPFGPTDQGWRLPPPPPIHGGSGGDGSGGSGGGGDAGDEGGNTDGGSGGASGSGGDGSSGGGGAEEPGEPTLDPADPPLADDPALETKEWRDYVLMAPWYVPGDLSMAPNQRVTMALGPVGQPEASGAIVAEGAVHLAGVLRIAWMSGSEPRVGDEWILVLGQQVTGQFWAVEMPPLAGKARARVVQLPDRVVLQLCEE